MNLSTAGSLVNARTKRKVTAGGPGSGRHKGFGNVLQHIKTLDQQGVQKLKDFYLGSCSSVI